LAQDDHPAPGEGPFKVHSETLPSPRELRDERGQPARNHFFVPSPGDRFGLPRTGGFPAIAFRDRTIAVLKRQQDVESLVLWRPGEPMKSYELPEQDLTGPFAIVDRVCAYSARRFYWLDGDEVRTVDQPSDFRPVVSVNEFTPLELPVGRPPFVVADHVAFLPGRIAGRPGFLSVGWDGRAPTFRPIVTSGGESFQRAAGDALLVAGGGRVRLAERSTFSQTLLEASALAPGPTLVHGKQIVVCCQSFGGRELRVYGDGSERVAMPPGCTPLDLFLLPGFLVLTAAVQSGVEILSWPLA
jgi:hypothetical protein